MQRPDLCCGASCPLGSPVDPHSAPKQRVAPQRPTPARSPSCGRAPPGRASTLTTPHTVPRHSQSLIPNSENDQTQHKLPPQRTSSSSLLWRSPSIVSASSSTSAASASPSLPSSMKLPRLPLLPAPQATLLSAQRRHVHLLKSPLNSGGAPPTPSQHACFGFCFWPAPGPASS